MMLTNLADVVRTSGLKVIEVPGWKTRGHGQMTSVEAIICHHTAGPKTGAYPSLDTVVDGRPGLDGPLAQLGLGRDCAVRIIAAGVCYHAGAVFETWQNNWHAIGIEAEATGVDPWPADQYDAYVKLCAALRHGYGVPNARVLGHKEVAKPKGRKPDPNFDMASFRAKVSVAYAVKPNQNPSGGELSATDADRVIAAVNKQTNAVSGHLQLNAAQHHRQLRTEFGAMLDMAMAGQTEELKAYADKLDAANDAEIDRLQAAVDELPKADG